MSADLEVRVARIEEVLLKAGLLKKQKQVGDDVTDASWAPFTFQGGVAHYDVTFEYACSCGQTHIGRETVKPFDKDGSLYEITGPCGQKVEMKIWKNKI
jgi:hypothetical protein